MAQRLVVGIYPGSDVVSIETKLLAEHVDLNRIKVLSRGRDMLYNEDSRVDFVDVAVAMESNSFSDDMTKGQGIMGDSGGTGVPGVGGRNPSLGAFTHDSRTNHLSALAIPDDEVGNYNTAIDEGRSVVAYIDADEDSNAIATAFKAIGLRNVRQYE